jgi:hypothetical protein
MGHEQISATYATRVMAKPTQNPRTRAPGHTQVVTASSQFGFCFAPCVSSGKCVNITNIVVKGFSRSVNTPSPLPYSVLAPCMDTRLSVLDTLPRPTKDGFMLPVCGLWGFLELSEPALSSYQISRSSRQGQSWKSDGDHCEPQVEIHWLRGPEQKLDFMLQ